MIRLHCQVLGVSRNGYYQYRQNREGNLEDPDQQEMIEWEQDITKSSWDNAVVESFFGNLKQERVCSGGTTSPVTRQQDILEYLFMFYNSRRLHSYLGYVSPNDFEQQLVEQKKTA